MRVSSQVDVLRQAVQEGLGHTAPSVRHAVSTHAAKLCHDDAPTEVPSNPLGYVDKVALHAYKVTDDDVEARKQARRTEDEIFEITVAAALGAALERLEIGLGALENTTT